MQWYHILYSDLLTSYRVFISRVKKHPFLTGFFIFIALSLSRNSVLIGLRLDNMDWGENPVIIDRWIFSIIFFSFVMGKVALYTYRKLIKEREMLTIFSQPVDMYQIILGKYLANLIYIAVLLLTGFFLFYAWLVVELGFIGIPLDILGEGILLTLLALSLGFTIPIFLQLKPWSKKIINLAGNMLLIGIVSVPIRFFLRDSGFFIILSVITVISFILVVYSSRYTLPAWLAQLSKPLRLSPHTRDRLLAQSKKGKFITPEAWIIAKKEMILLIREKDAIVTFIAAAFLSIASVGIYFYYGPAGVPNSNLGNYMYPGILAVFLFIGTLMVSALIGLAMISVEGRALYIIKSLPVESLDVLKGKSLALFILGFPIIVPMSIFLPMVAKFPLFVSLFFIILSNIFIVSFTGIGIWGGSMFPNFDPTARNMPDIISQFFIMFICIICSFFIVAIPVFIMTVNNLAGVVAALVGLGWAITIFIAALDRGVVGYDNIGSDMYM